MAKLSAKQIEVIELLKAGNEINYFRGIGTTYTPSASINGKTISISTVKALRYKGYLKEFKRELYHSYYKLKINKQ